MNKQALDSFWDQFRQKYGVYLRLLDMLPAERYKAQPVPGLRSAAELAVHVSGTVVRDIAQGIAAGSIKADEGAEPRLANDLDKPGLIAFARRCFDEADAAVARIVHHRGQLYVYARLFGVAPPFIWSFEDNAAEFRPATNG